MVESVLLLGSLTSAVSLCVAQETSEAAVKSKRTDAIFFGRLEIASINDSISRLNLDPTCQATGNDIADGGERFN
jgi:hypothetical protein